MNNQTYGSVLFMLSHYTDDVIAWLEERKTKKGFYHYLYEKLKNHLEVVTPISHYHQLTEMIHANLEQEAVKEKAEKLIYAMAVMYGKRRGL